MDETSPEDTLQKTTEALGAFMNAWMDAGTKAAKSSSLVLLDCLTAPLFDKPDDVVKNAQQRYASLATAWATFFQEVANALPGGGGQPGTGPGAMPGQAGAPGQIMRAGRHCSIALPVDFPGDAGYPITMDAQATVTLGPSQLTLAVQSGTIEDAGNAWLTLEATVPEDQQHGWYSGTVGYSAAGGQRGSFPVSVGVLPP